MWGAVPRRRIGIVALPIGESAMPPERCLRTNTPDALRADARRPALGDRAAGWTLEDIDVPELRNAVAEAVRIGRLNEPGSREPEDLLLALGLMRDGVLLRGTVVLFGST